MCVCVCVCMCVCVYVYVCVCDNYVKAHLIFSHVTTMTMLLYILYNFDYILQFSSFLNKTHPLSVTLIYFEFRNDLKFAALIQSHICYTVCNVSVLQSEHACVCVCTCVCVYLFVWGFQCES